MNNGKKIRLCWPNQSQEISQQMTKLSPRALHCRKQQWLKKPVCWAILTWQLYAKKYCCGCPRNNFSVIIAPISQLLLFPVFQKRILQSKKHFNMVFPRLLYYCTILIFMGVHYGGRQVGRRESRFWGQNELVSNPSLALACFSHVI